MSFNEYWVSSYREEATLDTSNMMAITNLTDDEKQTETFQKRRHAPLLWLEDYNINQFIYQQSTFSFSSQHFMAIFLSLLPFTGNLPFIHRPNTCIVVWQQLICWLVLLASPSMLFIGCSWFTNDTQGTQPT